MYIVIWVHFWYFQAIVKWVRWPKGNKRLFVFILNLVGFTCEQIPTLALKDPANAPVSLQADLIWTSMELQTDLWIHHICRIDQCNILKEIVWVWNTRAVEQLNQAWCCHLAASQIGFKTSSFQTSSSVFKRNWEFFLLAHCAQHLFLWSSFVEGWTAQTNDPLKIGESPSLCGCALRFAKLRGFCHWIFVWSIMQFGSS